MSCGNFSDNFDRASGPPGSPWVDQGHVSGWTIASDQLQAPTGGDAILTDDTCSGDGTITVTLVNGSTAQDAAIEFRVQDFSNRWVWSKNNSSLYGTYALARLLNGIWTTVAQTGVAARDGDVLQVALNGNSIIGQVNGNTLVSVTDPNLAAATQHGVGCSWGGPCLFDNFSYSTTLASTGPVVHGIAYSDNFNRTSLLPGTPWITFGASSWTISSSQLQSPGSGDGIMSYCAGSGDGTVAVTLINGATAEDGGIEFRIRDFNNRWVWTKNNSSLGGKYALARLLNGSWTTVAQTNLVARDGDALQVVMNGSRITAMVNGSVLVSVSDLSLAGATEHGMGCSYAGPCRFDDFSYSPTLAPTSWVVVQAASPGTEKNPPSTTTGSSSDPVSTLTGSFAYSHSDLAIAGRGPAPLVVRSYNSDDTRSGSLGVGWTDNDAVRLNSPGDGSADLLLVGAQGRSDRYTFQSGGAFSPPPAVSTTLVRNGDGTYSATQKDQSVWTFDRSGKFTSIADRYGNVSTLSYNGQGQLSAVADPAGRGSLSFAYNASGQRTSVSDWANRQVVYGYDGSGRLQTVTDRDGKQTTYGYDAGNHVTTMTDANGHTAVTMTYDGNGRVATQQDAQGLTTGQQTTFGYATTNPAGPQTTTVTYPATSFDGTLPTVVDSYNILGQLTQRTSKPSAAETYTESYAYDANFDLTSSTDPRGNTTQFCYDVDYTGAAIAGSRGNLTRVIAPAAAGGQNVPVTLTKYDAKNNIVEVLAPKGVASGSSASCSTNFGSAINAQYASDFAYDASGVTLLSTTRRSTDPDTGPQTATTSYQYNDGANPGRVTAVIAPLGGAHTTSVTYYTTGSQAGLPSGTTDGAGDRSSYVYDAVGRRTSMVDPNGQTWTTAYDNEDRVTSASAPAPQAGSPLTSQAQYDAVGNRTVVIDANGQVTKSLYDVRDQLAEVDQSPNAWTDPNASPSPKIATTYSYDHLGNLQRLTRAAGDSTNERATDYTYDGLNRLRKEVQYPAWPSTASTLVTTYAYDGAGNRASLTDPLTQTTSFGYDALDRLTAVTYSDGKTPNVAYAYDLNGNRTSMQDGTGTTTYVADELDRLTSVTSPSSVTVGSRYDLDGNRSKILYPDGTAVTSAYDNADRLASLTDWAGRSTGYGYFPDGNLKTVTNVNGTTATMSEDHAQRLTQVLNQQGSTTISQHSYTLDNVGNRTQAAETLAQVGGQPVTLTTTYAYDQLARLTGDGTNTYGYDPVGNRTSLGATSSAYDQANRLTAATVAGTITTYGYNGDGDRASETVGANPATAYVSDINGGLPVVLSDGARKYVYGAGLAYTVDTANTVQVYHTDGLGSVRALTDGSGALVQTYRTDAFGNPTQTQGTSSQPFGFTGQQRDGNGLVYLRARYYDPLAGRFLSRDPWSARSACRSRSTATPTRSTTRSRSPTRAGCPAARRCNRRTASTRRRTVAPLAKPSVGPEPGAW